MYIYLNRFILGYHLKTRKDKNGFTKDKRVILWKDFCKRGEQSNIGISNRKDPHTVCCYAHTGGTTGFPKTVELSDIAMNIVARDLGNSISHKTSMPHMLGTTINETSQAAGY